MGSLNQLIAPEKINIVKQQKAFVSRQKGAPRLGLGSCRDYRSSITVQLFKLFALNKWASSPITHENC